MIEHWSIFFHMQTIGVRNNGGIMNLNYDKNLKELEIILSDFACDKNCPYCTAKITKWPNVEDDIHSLELYVGQLKKKG